MEYISVFFQVLRQLIHFIIQAALKPERLILKDHVLYLRESQMAIPVE